jgi:N,N'-diacetyllegionaminate synthase
MRSLVIAEVGSCHDGQLKKALQLVEAARESGADAAKFQFWSNPDRLADRRNVPAHYREIYHRYQMIPSWLPVLKEACDARSPWTAGLRRIELMATTYLPEDIYVVAPFVDRFKVASFEAADKSFIWSHPGDKPIIVSLGMADEIPEHLQDGSRRVQLLHCVSAYPAPVDAMNLAVFHDHGPSYDPEPSPFLGLSDHSRHTWMGALAAVAGAQIIEAHIRLESTSPENPDYATAFTPAEFAEYVRNIRFAEQVMGTGEKRLQPCELEMSAYRVQG